MAKHFHLKLSLWLGCKSFKEFSIFILKDLFIEILNLIIFSLAKIRKAAPSLSSILGLPRSLHLMAHIFHIKIIKISLGLLDMPLSILTLGFNKEGEMIYKVCSTWSFTSFWVNSLGKTWMQKTKSRNMKRYCKRSWWQVLKCFVISFQLNW